MRVNLTQLFQRYSSVLLVSLILGCKPNPEGTYTYSHSNGAVEKLVLAKSTYTQEITSGTLTLYTNSSSYSHEGRLLTFQDFCHPSWEDWLPEGMTYEGGSPDQIDYVDPETVMGYSAGSTLAIPLLAGEHPNDARDFYHFKKVKE